MDITRFISDIRKRGILRGNSFSVNIPIPAYLLGAYGADTSGLTFRCDTATLPGINFATIDGPARYGYGPIEAVPYNVIYNESVLAFTVDKRSKVHQFFYDWMGVIVNFSNYQNGIDQTKTIGRSTMNTYEVGYKKDYTVDVKITMYDEQMEEVLVCTLYKAFPKSINQIDLAWDQVNQPVKLQVPISFREFTIEYKQ